MRISRPVASYSLLVIAAASFIGASVQADGSRSRCKRVRARVTLQASATNDCESPIDLCATGSLRGDLAGTSSFIGTSSTGTADTPTTGVVLLTGDNRIETNDGVLLTKDAIVLKTTGAGEFAEVDEIVGGSGEYEGASGTLTATGTFANGVGEGVLSGEVCVP